MCHVSRILVLVLAGCLSIAISMRTMGGEGEAGNKVGSEEDRIARLLTGILGVTDLQLGSSILGPRPKVTLQEVGRSGASTVRLVAKDLNVEIDSTSYLIVSYLNSKVLEDEAKSAPKDKWTPNREMLVTFLRSTDIFKTFGIIDYRAQFPVFEPKEYSPKGAAGATFVATRVYGKYKYLGERLVVRLSYDGKRLLYYGADFTPLPPKNDKVDIAPDKAREIFSKLLKEDTRIAAMTKPHNLILKDASVVVEPEPWFVHPNSFLKDEGPVVYRTSGPAYLAYVCRAAYSSDKADLDLMLWIDARDGTLLGGDFTQLIKTTHHETDALKDND